MRMGSRDNNNELVRKGGAEMRGGGERCHVSHLHMYRKRGGG